MIEPGFDNDEINCRHVVNDVSPDTRFPGTTSNLPGLSTGSSVYIIDMPQWFFTPNAMYRLALQLSTGPFQDLEDNTFITFPKTKVKISSINIGFATGLKILDESVAARSGKGDPEYLPDGK